MIGLLTTLTWLSLPLAQPKAPGNLDVPGQFPSISSAIAAAQDGDLVLVQPGTYFETIDFGGKDIVILGVSGPEVTILDAQGSDTVVRFESGETSSAKLEGFTVRNGVATGPGEAGGIQCTGSYPSIVNCVVRANRGGDAIGPGSFVGFGGAGGIVANEASPTIEGCLIEANMGGASGYLEAGPGGVLVLRAAGLTGNPDLHTSIRNCSIRLNQGGSYGGDDGHAGPGGAAILLSRLVSIVDTEIVRNVGGMSLAPSPDCNAGAGGLWLGSSDVVVFGCRILSNAGGQGGPGGGDGGVGGAEANSLPQSPPISFVNCVLAWNQGGCSTKFTSGDGGGDFFSPVDVANCSFVGNVAGSGPAGSAAGGARFFGGLPVSSTLTNTVFWLNEGATPADNSLIESDLEIANSLNTRQFGVVDPRFVNVDEDDFRLRCDSPAVDAGTGDLPTVPSVDIDGNPRPIGGQVDIGAYELVDPPEFPTFCISVPNSFGSTALIRGEGCTLIAENNTRIVVEGVTNTPGLFFYGPNPVQVTFGDGFRCVGGAVRRFPPTSGFMMSAEMQLDLGAIPVMPGTPTYFQYWYRDPMAGGTGFNLSNGLELTPR